MRSLFGWARALEAGERVGHGVLSQERDQFGLTSLERDVRSARFAANDRPSLRSRE